MATTLFYELDLVVLPYETDRLAERRRLAEEAERAWGRASGALADFPPRFARLPLLLLEGHWAEARDLALTTLAATRSHEAWRRYPGRYLGQLARAQGDTDLAWRLVREEFPLGPTTEPGATWFLPALTMQRLAAALARAEALAPRRLPAPSGDYPDDLTAREAEVLALIASGVSNQEIAEALYLSVRTVERHINSLYRKIDARGRAGATAYAARHGLLPS